MLANWTATPSGNHILDCVVFPGDTTNLCGPTAFGGGFRFWVNPGPSPDGGKYVAIDGDSNYASALTQTVSGLVIGSFYSLTFYQAAAQQMGFDGTTTERWSVTFGSDTQLSTLMNNANHGAVGWMSQTMTFKATATSQVLSFLAVGTPNGLPPFVLLDGVTLTAVPEPAVFTLMIVGFVGLPLARRLLKRRT